VTGESWADLQPEGFVRFDADIRDNLQVFAEASATTRAMAAVAGLKLTW